MKEIVEKLQSNNLTTQQFYTFGTTYKKIKVFKKVLYLGSINSLTETLKAVPHDFQGSH